MELTVLSNDADVLRLRVKGPIVQSVLAERPEPMGGLLGNQGYGRKVVLDMADTTFIDSSGLGWILGCNKRFRENAGKLVLHSLPPIVQDVMRVMQLDKVLAIAEDDSSAVALVHGGNA